MTEDHWLFEYTALRLREEQEAKKQEDMISRLLGLNVVPDEKTPYVPLSVLLASPETLKVMKKWADVSAVKKSISEEDEFERVSKLLAEGAQLDADDDMVPIVKTRAEKNHERALELVPERKGVILDDAD